MSGEVRETHLYDITLPVRDMKFDDNTGREPAAIPNVDAVSARVTYSTRALVGDRRIPATLWGVEDFTRQSIDVVRVTSGAAPAGGQVLADDGNADAVDVSLAAGDRLRLVAADGSVGSPEVSGGARSLAFRQGPSDQPKQLILYATNNTVRALSGVSGVNSLAFRLHDTEPRAVDATVTRLHTWLKTNVGPGALTNLPVTRDEGDYPGRVFAHQMTTFVYVLAALALITAVFLIANTMNTLMAEQTAEIGVMKAIGGRRRQIAGVFLRTALYLALFGVVVGVPIGIALAHMIANFVASNVLGVPGRFAVSIPVIAFSAVFAVVLTVGASAPALRRALRIPVREALQSQGAAVTFGVSPIDRLVVHDRLLPRTIRFGARNLVRNKRRTAATTLQIALAVATALGFLNMAISFGRSLEKDYSIIAWDASMYAPAGAPRLDAAAAVQKIPGIGPTLGAVLVAEIGDVSWFASASKLTCWAGLTPKHHESDTHVRRGRITKQGSRLVRWAAIESVKTISKTSEVGVLRERVGDRRGRSIGSVAAARLQLELVFYALRDGHVRALEHLPRVA